MALSMPKFSALQKITSFLKDRQDVQVQYIKKNDQENYIEQK